MVPPEPTAQILFEDIYVKGTEPCQFIRGRTTETRALLLPVECTSLLNQAGDTLTSI